MASSASALNARVREAAGRLLAKLQSIDATVAGRATASDAVVDVTEAFDDCLAELAELQLWGPDNRLPSSELWNAAGHLLCRGWLQNQARSKPRGYAGDYEMLARIYERRLCDEALGRLFDVYFQSQAAPQAVRNRMAMITDWIVAAAGSDRSLRVAVVGSAFGLEIRDALLRLEEPARARIQVTLLDVDPAAIDFARGQLQDLLPREQLIAESTNLFRLPQRPAAAEPLGGSDLIYCPGLFDYLDDATAAAMLRCLYERLARGGRLSVFQFARHNPTRAYMEWFGNWYLTYRDAAALRQLVESAGLQNARFTYGAEPLGIDLFVTIQRG
jgi:extracellular factor (EF) 3-hydroxypalmitic acid methyl ester biosynthesis protein